MLKLLLIIVITTYVLSKIGRFFFRMGMTSSQSKSSYKPREGNVNVENPPRKPKTHVKGGEYIDYEEVK